MLCTRRPGTYLGLWTARAAYTSDSGIQGYTTDLPPHVYKHKGWLPLKDKRQRGTARTLRHPWCETVHHRVKPRPVKGTWRMRLDLVRPHPDLVHVYSDPVKQLYSYQLTAFPRSCTDPIPEICALTKTALPLHLDGVLGNGIRDPNYLECFLGHVEESCHVFNSSFKLKEVPANPSTPHEEDVFSKYFASSFIHNLLNFLYKDPRTPSLLAQDSFITADQFTGAFWRHGSDQRKNACNRFQLMNHLDIILRTGQPITYEALRSDEVQPVPITLSLSHVTHSRLNLFRERRKVHQFPGFLKESFYPHNHTVFKVVSKRLSDEDMRYAALITGFGQAFASVQHQADFPVIVDQIPPVNHPSTAQVVITDGHRFCFGVYQCNTTDTNETQLDDPYPVNMCALSPVETLTCPDNKSMLNINMLRTMLTLLSYDQDEVGLVEQKEKISGTMPVELGSGS